MRQVLILFLPVTLSIGIVNLDVFINAGFGSLVSSHAPAAINDAFRIYMLPQGIFSVAVATVLFPTLSRMAARRDVGGMRRTVGNGMRQINLLLIPSSALMLVLATPITRLIYQHGAFDRVFDRTDVSTALFWFSFSLPFAGVNLLLTPDVLRAQAAVDPDQARGDEHGRRRDRQHRAVQAARDRRTGDRDRGRQRGHDLRSSCGGCGSASTAVSRAGRR